MHNGYPPPHRYQAYAARPSNGLGVAGFIVSLVGLVATCGVLCPLGLLLSFFALFRRPRGMAIAGTVIGLVGTLFVAGFLLLITANAVTHVKHEQRSHHQAATREVFSAAHDTIVAHRVETGRLPGGIEGNKLLLELSDGWGNSIRYDLRDDDASYVLRSAGPDGQFDTGDDLTSVAGRPLSRGK